MAGVQRKPCAPGRQHGCIAAVLLTKPPTDETGKRPFSADDGGALVVFQRARRFAQRGATNPTPSNNVRTINAPAWRGADGLARRLRQAMHLAEGPQAHNAHYANAPRSGALAPEVSAFA